MFPDTNGGPMTLAKEIEGTKAKIAIIDPVGRIGRLSLAPFVFFAQSACQIIVEPTKRLVTIPGSKYGRDNKVDRNANHWILAGNVQFLSPIF